jgi:pimeloyl-ACP methyl ester carboxylesterase
MAIPTAWSDIMPRFAARRPVIAIEAQGHGATPDRPGPFRLAQLIDDVAGVLDALRIQRADLFGFSLGGMTALGMAINHPDRVRDHGPECRLSGRRFVARVSGNAAKSAASALCGVDATAADQEGFRKLASRLSAPCARPGEFPEHAGKAHPDACRMARMDAQSARDSPREDPDRHWRQ